MMIIPTARVQISFTEELQGPPLPHLLRGAIAKLFVSEPLLHQHQNDGFIYRYPLVQYRWANGKGIMIGFHDGGRLLANLSLLNQELELGGKKTTVSGMEINFSMEEISFSRRLVRYHFVSPWLPFNQENFEAYTKMNKAKQAYERDRLAIANLLMALRGLKVTADGQIYAAFQIRRIVPCKYKEHTFMGFLGTLLTNVALPDDVAIGKAVSHGYGWLKRSNLKFGR